MYNIPLSALGVAAALILVNALVSLVLRLGLERRLLLAAVRTVVQLAILGLILKSVFEHDHPLILGAVLLFMTTVAGLTAVSRTDRRYPGIWLNGMLAAASASWLVTLVMLTLIIPLAHWSGNAPQYAIPLLGMVLGNTLNGLALGLDRFGEQLAQRRGEVEMKLCLGATRWEAAGDVIRDAIRTGTIPIINSMTVVGLVSLPGMMTGQMLAGADPVVAVKYQIMIMFVIAAGTALGTMTAVLLSYRRVFCRRHYVDWDALSRRPS